MDMHLTESSSNIAAIGWTASGPTLRVAFKTKKENEPQRVYDYEDVGEALFMEFLNAPSKGQFFQARIKGRFPTRRIQ
jgi:hypothetical protein